MSSVFQDISERNRLPMFFLFLSIVLAFAFIRFSVRMIRAEVKWWPGNVTPGGLHIHHVVFGLVFMLVGGFGLVALAHQYSPVASCILASIFGVGVALVLDEFAMVLHLRDVYWAEEGRSSIDTVFVAIAVTGLFILGIHPMGFAGDFDALRDDGSIVAVVSVFFFFAVNCAIAVVVLLKGKFWTGFLGLFFSPLLLIGAIRLSRPEAPWARKFYTAKPAKLARAEKRERQMREPVIRRKIWVQEAVAGKFGT
ncbi:hypothetical protein [Antrihabitans sp. YC2-6]|uniref:hypothetical protein n=1 Tax=Antrihabitans sp. YC2-6 TaxID=2799498 RepID=UPI001F1D80C9|nr:hypothetical protein [Antrihabitans sp. YC2-6]